MSHTGTVVPFPYAGMIQIRFPGCILSPAFSDRTPPTEVDRISEYHGQNAIWRRIRPGKGCFCLCPFQ
jgi:hypothetical protein